MADSLRSTAPVSPAGGYPSHPSPRGREGKDGRPFPREAPSVRAEDRVCVGAGRLAGLRLLRERVLVRTRGELRLGEHVVVPTFAEVFEDEPTGVFLGRLLSAQNQLAAQCGGALDGSQIRRAVDAGLRGGAEETILWLHEERRDASAIAAVTDVLTEYGRRLQVLVAELEPPREPAAR